MGLIVVAESTKVRPDLSVEQMELQAERRSGVPKIMGAPTREIEVLGGTL